MCCLLDRVMLRSNSVQPLLAFQCLPSCVLPGLPSEMMRACDRLHLRCRSSYQVRGSIYHAYNFQLTLPSYRKIDCLILPPHIYASMMKPKQPCPPHPRKPCSAMLLSLAAQPLLSMHASILSTVASWVWYIILLYCCRII